MFDELKNKPIEIFFDEWGHGKEFKLGIYNFLKETEVIVKRNSKYYNFSAILGKNLFRVKPGQVVRMLISKACFDKEIIRHLNFDLLPEDEIDLIMIICRKDKYHLEIKQLEYIEHKKVGDDILNYENRLDVKI